MRMLAQRVVAAPIRSRVQGALEAALGEEAPLSTPQPIVSREYRTDS
jgi:hypothetical protein